MSYIYDEWEIDRIISTYNTAASSNLQKKSEPNRAAVKKAFEAADSYIQLSNFIRRRVRNHEGAYDHVVGVCNDFCALKSVGCIAEDGSVTQPSTEPVVVTQTQTELKPLTDEEAKAFAGLSVVGDLARSLLSSVNITQVQDLVVKDATEKLGAFIRETYGILPHKTEVDVAGKKTLVKGVVHEKFDTVIKAIFKGTPVYMVGPAGTGKNVIAKQVAEALGLPFYFTGAVSQSYKLFGFTDAMGHYQESQFYKAYTGGGVFFFDEFDCSIPEVVKEFNAAIDSRYCDFPAPIGRVDAHPDFRVIAAANTFGLGADYEYVGAYQQDASTLNRFMQVRVDYDPRIEEACAEGDTELLGFCRAFRKACQKAGIRQVVSYRNISQMAELGTGKYPIDAVELIDGCLTRALGASDLQILRNELNGYGKWTAAFGKLADEMRARG